MSSRRQVGAGSVRKGSCQTGAGYVKKGSCQIGAESVRKVSCQVDAGSVRKGKGGRGKRKSQYRNGTASSELVCVSSCKIVHFRALLYTFVHFRASSYKFVQVRASS